MEDFITRIREAAQQSDESITDIVKELVFIGAFDRERTEELLTHE